MRRVAAALAAAVAGLAASCAADRPAPAPAPVAAFQRHLDESGVPYAVPPAGKAILVNVPAFELIAFKDGRPVLRSRVIVGKPSTPTPLLETHVTEVRFRPSWRPTPAMVASGEYPDRRWPPGPRNPLGLAAIRLEPGLLVYLHDTNRRSLFDRPMRALSHGCIRVERWEALIAWLLGTDLATVDAWANGARTLDVPAPPVPVTIGYFLRFPDDAGRPQRFDDVYGRGSGEAPRPSVAVEGCPSARA